jgi:probable addiction module antidote protein
MLGRTVVYLLLGGSRKTQKADIRKAEATVRTMDKTKGNVGRSRVRERRTDYTAEGDEPIITEADITFAPFDAADYMRGDDETQIYLLRQAFASGHAGYIASAVAAVARARGLTGPGRETGIERRGRNRSPSLKANPTVETLTSVLDALGLRLELVENRPPG